MKCHLLAFSVLFTAGSLLAQTAPNGERYVNTPFFDDFTGTAVNTTTWQVAAWVEHSGQTSPTRCFVRDGNLVMQFINSSTDGFLSSAIQTRQEFYFGKWEYRAKASSVPGVLNSFYTIDWDNTAASGSTSDGTKEEIDIEFLTKSFSGSTGQVHYALHKSSYTSFQTNPDVALGFNPSAGYHVYGYNITPTRIDWLADSVVKRTYVYSGNPITITAPYQQKLNFWSAVSWIGGPPTPDVVCEYLIDWIKFTPYQSGPVYDDRSGHMDGRDLFPRVGHNQVSYTLAKASPVQFRLFDTAGKMVKEVIDAQDTPGTHTVSLEGNGVQAGVHLFILSAGQQSVSGKAVVVR